MSAVVGLLLSGCGATSSTTADGSSERKGGGRSSTTSSTAVTTTLWAEFKKTVDLPAVPFRVPAGLKPRGGFQQADVDALARRALDVLKRSSDPRLSRMDSTDAVDYVYANQYGQSTFRFKSDAAEFTGGYDWQWLAASRYPSIPSAPKVIKLVGKVFIGRGRLSDGTPAPFLAVNLQAHIVQTVVNGRYGAVPIVVRRTVRASGYRPRGGPDWWPGVDARATPFGNTACGLFKGAVLRPMSDPDELRTDLANLKTSLDNPTIIPEDFGHDSDPKKVRTFVDKSCAEEAANSDG